MGDLEVHGASRPRSFDGPLDPSKGQASGWPAKQEGAASRGCAEHEGERGADPVGVLNSITRDAGGGGRRVCGRSPQTPGNRVVP